MKMAKLVKISMSARSIMEAASTDALTPGAPTTVNATRVLACMWTAAPALLFIRVPLATEDVSITVCSSLLLISAVAASQIISWQRMASIVNCGIPVQIRMEAACMSVVLMVGELTVTVKLVTFWLKTGKPVKILMSVRQKRPTVLTAATTHWALTPVCVMLPMSWDLMENSVTKSRWRS